MVFKYIKEKTVICVSKCNDVKNYGLQNLPDRAKIFLTALWFWVYIAYYCNKLINYTLCVVLTYTPDAYMAYPAKLLNKDKPKILYASLGNTTITNKLKLLINTNWDTDVPDNGGVNVRDLVSKYPSLAYAVIWVSYIFEIDKKINTMTNEELGKSIKHMYITISGKTINRGEFLDDEEIIFGEITF
jgi:hypothetical protein